VSHIGVDMDDVVVDFVGGLVDAMKKEHGATITDKQLEEAGWDLAPLLNPIIGQNWWTWLRESEWLWANFPAVDGAIGGLRTLRRDGHYLELITSKPEWAEHNVWKWLGKWRPPFNQVTIVGPKDQKIDFTDADVLIDDKPENCKQFTDNQRVAILFERPHNRGAETQAFRAANWQEILAIARDKNNGW